MQLVLRWSFSRPSGGLRRYLAAALGSNGEFGGTAASCAFFVFVIFLEVVCSKFQG